MTLRNNPVRRIVTTRKPDGRLAIGLVGEERREFPRVVGAFKAAEDAAYSSLRAESEWSAT